MTAKELKEIINEIPDNKKVIFEYSCFTFENISKIIYNKKEIARCRGWPLKDFKEDYPGKNYVMIDFTN